MSYDTATQDAIDRLSTFYNGSAYNAGTNPGGLALGGHRVNFANAIADIATAANAVGPLAQSVESALLYLGAAAANPTTMGDGGPLQAGAFYFNTGAARLRVYNGTGWTEITANTNYFLSPTVITNAESPYTASDGDVLLCRTSTGAITINLPASGKIKVVDVDGSAATNNIVVDPPTGDSVGAGAANENFEIDLNYFSCELIRRPSGTNWSVA